MTWQLWRQDDHGNESLIREFDDRTAAEQARDELASRGHHQHYWIRGAHERDPPLEESRG